MDIGLAIKLSKAVHDMCKEVPHDIGLTLERIVREHKSEGLGEGVVSNDGKDWCICTTVCLGCFHKDRKCRSLPDR